MLQLLPKDIIINHLLILLSYADIKSMSRVNKKFKTLCLLDDFWKIQYYTYYANNMKKKENSTWFEFFVQVYTRMQQKYPSHPPIPSSLTWDTYHKLLQSSHILPIPDRHQNLGHVYIIPGITTLKMFLDQYQAIVGRRHCAFSINSLSDPECSNIFKYSKGIASVQFERIGHEGRPSSRNPGISVITKVIRYITDPIVILNYLIDVFNTRTLDYLIPADYQGSNFTKLPTFMLDLVLMPFAKPPKKSKATVIDKYKQDIQNYVDNFIATEN